MCLITKCERFTYSHAHGAWNRSETIVTIEGLIECHNRGSMHVLAECDSMLLNISPSHLRRTTLGKS